MGLALSQEVQPDGELIFLQGSLRDSNGTLVTSADVKLTAQVSGDAVLAGFGSGNPKPDYNYNDGVADTWNGRTALILRKTADTGTVHVKVATEGGLTTELDIVV